MSLEGRQLQASSSPEVRRVQPTSSGQSCHRRQRERKACSDNIQQPDIDDLASSTPVDTAIDRTAGKSEDASRTEEVIKRPAHPEWTCRREGFTTPKGNIVDPNSEAVSIFRDITYRSFRGYSALDGNNRQVYTYDDNGNLLYVFGGKGLQVGNLLEPVALDVMSDERILILDKGATSLQSTVRPVRDCDTPGSEVLPGWDVRPVY